MTTTISTDAPTAQPARPARTRLPLAIVAVAVLAVASFGAWLLTRPAPALCADVPGARVPVNLVTAQAASGEIPAGGRNLEVAFTAVSDLGVTTPLLVLHADGFGVPVSIAAADGQPHRIVVRLVQDGSAVVVTAERDGQQTATTRQPGTIPDVVRVDLRAGEHTSGTVLVGQVSCRTV